MGTLGANHFSPPTDPKSPYITADQARLLLEGNRDGGLWSRIRCACHYLSRKIEYTCSPEEAIEFQKLLTVLGYTVSMSPPGWIGVFDSDGYKRKPAITLLVKW